MAIINPPKGPGMYWAKGRNGNWYIVCIEGEVPFLRLVGFSRPYMNEGTSLGYYDFAIFLDKLEPPDEQERK